MIRLLRTLTLKKATKKKTEIFSPTIEFYTLPLKGHLKKKVQGNLNRKTHFSGRCEEQH